MMARNSRRTSVLAGLAVLAGIYLTPSAVQAQAPGNTTPDAPKFESIRTPTSPAFTLLGVAPSAVEKPNTPSEFAASFLSRANGLDTVPKDFALEVSPYWLRNHRRVTWQKEQKRSLLQSLARTATFSIATNASGTEESPITSLAIGARGSVLSGHLSSQAVAQIANLEKLLRDESTLGNELIKVQLTEITRQLVEKKITKEEYVELSTAIVTAMSNSQAFKSSPQVKARLKAVDAFVSARQGVMLEIAGAAAWSYANAVWSNHEFDQWGVWATPSYQGAHGSLIGVLRYSNKDAVERTAILDIGIRALRSVDRYAFSIEYVRRRFPDTTLDDRYRLVGVAEYNVGAGHWAVVSFGRDHNSIREGSLVAKLGLTLNFSEERYKAP